jgi:hypothetical protein
MGTINWISLSGFLVSISGMYYIWQVYTRKAPGNPVSWAAWAVIGWALYLTSNVPFGVNAQTFGAVNPTAIALIAAWRQYSEAQTPSTREILGGVLGCLAIILWLLAEYQGAPTKWILGLSIAADCIPLWLIAEGAWENPRDDKPFAWLLFSFGYGISAFGLEKFSVFTLALPVYMFVGANIVAWPLVRYRMLHSIPIRQWV